MLARNGLQKSKVKAVALSPLKEHLDEEKMELVYGRIKSKEKGETLYYTQEFKIACAFEKYYEVFLHSDYYKLRSIFLKDIDITMDYSGSFDKEEIIRHITEHKGFRLQCCIDDANRTILDNSDQVGNNCLTYMETVDGMTTLCKIYNKMVQMLESKSVREMVNTGKIGFVKKTLVSQRHAILLKIGD